MNDRAQLLYYFYMLLLGTAQRYILDRVSVHPKTGCWLWLGCNDGRYGHAYFLGQRFKAHRLAYLAFSGPIPRGRVVDHKECDRTRCCCPAHLSPVTQSKNIKRCFAVGRGRSPFMKVSYGEDALV